MNVIIGNKIKELRRNKCMTQEDVAEYLHMSQSAYARMEAGDGHSWAIHLKEICKVFDVVPEELFKEKKSGNEKNNTDVITQKLIEQYEERIKELKQTIEDMKAMINKKASYK